MILKHVALVSSSEEHSDKFFVKLLGLKKMGSKILSASLSEQIFEINSESKIVNYADDNIHFEIFINDMQNENRYKFGHVCLQVENLMAFLKKCRDIGVKIMQIPKGDAMLIFVKDDDGNLFEIK